MSTHAFALRDAPVFFRYALNLFKLLKEQQDLYFPTQLIGPKKAIYRQKTGEADYSNRAKVALEHAPNVILAMQQSFQQHLYFATLLSTHSTVEQVHAKITPAFNPYIHGTNSSTLALMTQTDFQLMSPVEMLEQYQKAPLCGELTQGGLASALSDGKPCFARLNGKDDSNEYSLNTVISDYAIDFKPLSHNKCKAELIRSCELGQSHLHSNISIINIYLARAKQLGINLKDIPQVQSLEKDMNQSKEVFYLYLLLATHIVARNDWKLPKLSKKCEFIQLFNHHSSLVKLFKKMTQTNISVQNIYHHPTNDNCQKIIDILCSPQNQGDSPWFEYTDTPIQHNGFKKKLPPKLVFRNKYPYCFPSTLAHVVMGTHSMTDLMALKPYLDAYLNILEKRFEVTQKLLKSPAAPLPFFKTDAQLIDKSFPIILVYNQDNHIRIADMSTQEYRAQKPLVLGQDIQIIATDNAQNKKRLQNYVDRHKIDVKLTTFDKLEQLKESLYTDFPLSFEEVLKPDIHAAKQQENRQSIVRIGFFAECKRQTPQSKMQFPKPNAQHNTISKYDIN